MMKNRKIKQKLKFLTGAVFFAIILAACGGAGGQVQQSPLLAAFEKKFGMIAFIGLDGNVYTMDQAGKNLQAISQDAQVPTDEDPNLTVYQEIAWSKDSQQLAFTSMSQNTEDSSNPISATLYTSKVNEDGVPIKAFESDEELPLYLYWSPNSREVGFLTTTSARSAYILQRVGANGGDVNLVDVGSPYYWTWSPDSEQILTHAGGGVNNLFPDRIAFLDVTTKNVTEDLIGVVPGPFQSPAFSADGQKILIGALNGNRMTEIMLMNKVGDYERTLKIYADGLVAFGFSPDGQKVAMINGFQGLDTVIQGQLTVMDINDPEKTYTTEVEDVVGFFWSPDSERLAYFTYNSYNVVDSSAPKGEGAPDVNLNLMKLYVYAHEDNTAQEHSEFFRTSDQFIDVIRFFDQYQHSATIWSPDSRYIVVPVVPFSTNVPEIWLMSGKTNLQPRMINQGVLAFWSWE